MNENRGFQTDFGTVLDTCKSTCTINDSTVFLGRGGRGAGEGGGVNEQNGFKNSTCKRLFLETEIRI